MLDKYCVGCHNDQPRPDGRPISDLRGGRIAGPDSRDPALGAVHPDKSGCCIWHLWPINRSVSYEILHRYVRRPGAESDYHLLPPLEYHADTSELVQMLRKGHHGVQLDAEAWDRLVTWIDLNVPYHGNWGEYNIGQPGAHERRREYARLFANLDEDPELLPPLPREPVKPVMPPPAGAAGVAERRGSGLAVHRRRSETSPAETRRANPAPAAPDRPSCSSTWATAWRCTWCSSPPGEFLMGDAAGCDDEQPASRVRIERPFWMGQFEVTNEQYALFDPRHDSRYISLYGKDVIVRGLPVNRPKQPVVRVPWTGRDGVLPLVVGQDAADGSRCPRRPSGNGPAAAAARRPCRTATSTPISASWPIWPTSGSSWPPSTQARPSIGCRRWLRWTTGRA